MGEALNAEKKFEQQIVLPRAVVQANYGIDYTSLDQSGRSFLLGLLCKHLHLALRPIETNAGEFKLEAWSQHPGVLAYKRLFLNKRINSAYRLPVTLSLIGNAQRVLGIRVSLYNPNTVAEDAKLFVYQEEEYNTASGGDVNAPDGALQMEKNFFSGFGFVAIMKYIKIVETPKDSGRFTLTLPSNKPFPQEEIALPTIPSFEFASVHAMAEMAKTNSV